VQYTSIKEVKTTALVWRCIKPSASKRIRARNIFDRKKVRRSGIKKLSVFFVIRRWDFDGEKETSIKAISIMI
jgi:hypothetical protein